MLAQGLSEDEAAQIRKSETTGRPLGDAGFVKRLSKRLKRDDIQKKKPGPKPGQTAKRK